MSSADTGSIVTVTGRIDPDELGTTLPHEHVFFDGADALFVEPESAAERAIARQGVSIEHLSWLRRHPASTRDNLRATATEQLVDELQQFSRAGGDAVVDVTPKRLGENPAGVRTIAEATGLTIVHGTGYYVEGAHPNALTDRTVDAIADEFVRDVRDGINDTDVRAGIIGEIGVSGRIHDDEEKVLRAAARAATHTGAPLTIHPPGKTPYSQRDRTYPTSRWGLEILDIVEAEGIAPERVVIGHVDRSLYADLEYQKRVAGRGAFLEYDLFGRHAYLEAIEDGYPSDTWRVESIRELIDAGYLEQLLLSQDVATKTSRVSYGGDGYAHILETIVPMMRHRGISEEEISTVLEANPKRLLTFAE
ncbi:phosphotriesterase-related protein [Natronorubrum sp. JWXQ-INN-674]|uniref:Phosphotriesterase-related protein n=1 Tax=Natronorubrum halalkaliphilum TaxID=2691917 RepID=A0A6B0VGM3_9EURY|nr:TatD family hydrolase [Natronorubrum halalkaliphilum]MXV60533.1 phosphotriesterase-related protein [Natronorubrum halalkaliphilum]